MGELGGSAWLVLAIAGLWLAIAAPCSSSPVAGCATRIPSIAAATSMAALLEVAPSRPLLVRPDGSIEADERLLRELGVKDLRSGTCAILSARKWPARQMTLAKSAKRSPGAALSGMPFECNRSGPSGSNRIFEVRGGPAPPPEPAGTILLWFSDTSSAEAERSKLALANPPDGSGAGLAYPPDRSGSFSDVVSRAGPAGSASSTGPSSRRSKRVMPRTSSRDPPS